MEVTEHQKQLFAYFILEPQVMYWASTILANLFSRPWKNRQLLQLPKAEVSLYRDSCRINIHKERHNNLDSEVSHYKSNSTSGLQLISFFLCDNLLFDPLPKSPETGKLHLTTLPEGL